VTVQVQVLPQVLRTNNTAQKLLKRSGQISSLICSSKQACSLQYHVWLVAYPGFMGVPSSPGAKHKSWQSQPQESSILQAAYHALTCRGHLQVPFSPGLSSQFNLLVCLAHNRGASKHSAAQEEESQEDPGKGWSSLLSPSWSPEG